MIELHYCATPNGQKVAIMLEELGLPYELIAYDIFEGDQLRPEFEWGAAFYSLDRGESRYQQRNPE